MIVDLLAPIAQISVALGTIALALLAYFQLALAREVRVSQERPQVIVDTDYSDQDVVDIVVRNIGKGAAKDVTFEFSAPLDSSLSSRPGSEALPLNELPYFKQGIEFLAPGAEIRALWDTYVGLFPLLREKGLDEGIRVTSRYESLSGRPYETEWVINPLRLSGAPHVRRRGIDDLAKSVEKMSKNLDRVTQSRRLRVMTQTEQRRENERLRKEIESEREDQERAR